jgi:hypothetical protein
MLRRWAGGAAQVLECLHCKHEALSSNPSTAKKVLTTQISKISYFQTLPTLWYLEQTYLLSFLRGSPKNLFDLSPRVLANHYLLLFPNISEKF